VFATQLELLGKGGPCAVKIAVEERRHSDIAGHERACDWVSQLAGERDGLVEQRARVIGAAMLDCGIGGIGVQPRKAARVADLA
jgi:hypothetical protein